MLLAQAEKSVQGAAIVFTDFIRHLSLLYEVEGLCPNISVQGLSIEAKRGVFPIGRSRRDCSSKRGGIVPHGVCKGMCID